MAVVVALEPGRGPSTAPLDAVRLAPGDDLAAVTAAQLRDVVGRLVSAGQWRTGDPDILVVADAGYDGPRLAWLLRDLPYRYLPDAFRPGPAPDSTTRISGTNGRPCRHGAQFIIADPATWGSPDVATTIETRLYGQAIAPAWDRLPSGVIPKPVWLWWSGIDATPADVDRIWQAFLR